MVPVPAGGSAAAGVPHTTAHYTPPAKAHTRHAHIRYHHTLNEKLVHCLLSQLQPVCRPMKISCTFPSSVR